MLGLNVRVKWEEERKGEWEGECEGDGEGKEKGDGEQNRAE